MRLRRSKIRIMHAGGNIERATCECVRGYVERGKEGARTTGWPRQLPKKRKLRKEKEKKRDGITRKLYIFFHYIYIVFYFIELPIASSLRKMIFLIEFSRKIPSRAYIEHDLPSVSFFFSFCTVVVVVRVATTISRVIFYRWSCVIERKNDVRVRSIDDKRACTCSFPCLLDIHNNAHNFAINYQPDIF